VQIDLIADVLARRPRDRARDLGSGGIVPRIEAPVQAEVMDIGLYAPVGVGIAETLPLKSWPFFQAKMSW